MGMIPTRMNPLGWKPKKETGPYWGLTFTAEQDNSTIKLQKNGSPTNVSLSVSYDDGVTWSAYTVGDTITLASVGDKVCFAASSGVTNTTFASSTTAYHGFVMTGNIAASGDISSIRQNSKTAKNLTMAKYCYAYMFYNCTALTTAPELPATTLADECYYCMFWRCTSLTTAPDLPATTLADYCYYAMFNSCTALATAPALPATTLATYCYEIMFYSCKSLTTAPELPATTLADYCYRNMFAYCTALTTAPSILPATTLAKNCYYYMFRDCSSLTTAPVLPATSLASNCYTNMFYNCKNLNWVEVGFTSWTGASSPTSFWLSGVSSTGTFRCPAALGDDSTITRGVSNCPYGWTVVNI